jgi:hypothetical protein
MASGARTHTVVENCPCAFPSGIPSRPPRDRREAPVSPGRGGGAPRHSSKSAGRERAEEEQEAAGPGGPHPPRAKSAGSERAEEAREH